MLHRWILSLLFLLLMAGCGVPPSQKPLPLTADPADPADPVEEPGYQTPAGGVLATEAPPELGKEAWGATKAASSGPLVVVTDPGDLPELHIAGNDDDKLPLEHTHVKAQLAGFAAQVEVTQTFRNPHAAPIEVVYVFPLPENSAVNAMRMTVGRRVIAAKIERRENARRIYQRAKRRGHTAALLEQERANVFTQSVANIAPGDKIDVTTRYVQDLSYDSGQYEFVFPMVVGPRFIPGTTLDQAMKGTGTFFDTDQVPDASRITPPVLGKGQRSGHDISLELTATADFAIGGLQVPTHDVMVRRPADGSLKLTLAERKSIPNRDFVLRYQVAGKEPLAKLLTSGDDDGYFALLVHPPRLDVDDLVGRRELIFVVDVSGSMSGTPLGMAKMAMRSAIGKLRPYDTFNIITFAGATSKAFPTPRPASRHHVDQALRFLARARAGGGTYMANAVDEALAPGVAKGRNRYVFFLTDGYVGNEQAIITGSKDLVEALEGRGQRARVFGFGVGSSVNRQLLEGLSRAGKGVAVYATTREDPARAVNRFYRYIDRAVLTDVRVLWGDMAHAELYPRPIPDLFASHPIIVHGRHHGLTGKPITVQARMGEKTISIPVTVRKVAGMGGRGGVLGALWARNKVQFIEEESWIGMRPNAAREITQLGLGYDLVTPFTSFVAVDRSRVVSNGNPNTIVQPVETPEGVSAQAAGARTHRPRVTLANPAQPGYGQPSVGGDADGYGYEFSDDPLAAPGASPAPPSMGAGDDDDDDARMKLDEELEYAESAPPSADRGPRGCSCRAAGSQDGDDGLPLSLGALLLGLALARRRRRRAGERRPG